MKWSRKQIEETHGELLSIEIKGFVTVTNMKIVLDSEELIGATSRKIDDSLGTLEMRKGRGN